MTLNTHRVANSIPETCFRKSHNYKKKKDFYWLLLYKLFRFIKIMYCFDPIVVQLLSHINYDYCYNNIFLL